MWERTLSLHISQPISTCLRLLFKLHVLLPSTDSQGGCVGFTSPADGEAASRGMGWHSSKNTSKSNSLSLGVSTGEKQAGAGAAFGKGCMNTTPDTQLLHSQDCSGLCDQPESDEGTAQTHKHVKGWIFKWKSAEFTAAELGTSQQPLCAA